MYRQSKLVCVYVWMHAECTGRDQLPGIALRAHSNENTSDTTVMPHVRLPVDRRGCLRLHNRTIIRGRRKASPQGHVWKANLQQSVMIQPSVLPCTRQGVKPTSRH